MHFSLNRAPNDGFPVVWFGIEAFPRHIGIGLYQAHYTASLSLIETLHKGGAYKFGPSTGTGK